MKKLIFGLLLLFSVTTKLVAQEETGRTTTKYWYYPSQNVYFNDVSGTYWFYDDASVQWVESSRLPFTYTMNDKDPRYELYYKGTSVWKQNKQHKIKYNVKKDDTVKQKNR